MLLGLTVPKLLLILFIGFVVFGPGKLPKVGKSLGESLRAFKAAKTFRGEVSPYLSASLL